MSSLAIADKVLNAGLIGGFVALSNSAARRCLNPQSYLGKFFVNQLKSPWGAGCAGFVISEIAESCCEYAIKNFFSPALRKQNDFISCLAFFSFRVVVYLAVGAAFGITAGFFFTSMTATSGIALAIFALGGCELVGSLNQFILKKIYKGSSVEHAFYKAMGLNDVALIALKDEHNDKYHENIRKAVKHEIYQVLYGMSIHCTYIKVSKEFRLICESQSNVLVKENTFQEEIANKIADRLVKSVEAIPKYSKEYYYQHGELFTQTFINEFSLKVAEAMIKNDPLLIAKQKNLRYGSSDVTQKQVVFINQVYDEIRPLLTPFN